MCISLPILDWIWIFFTYLSRWVNMMTEIHLNRVVVVPNLNTNGVANKSFFFSNRIFNLSSWTNSMMKDFLINQLFHKLMNVWATFKLWINEKSYRNRLSFGDTKPTYLTKKNSQNSLWFISKKKKCIRTINGVIHQFALGRHDGLWPKKGSCPPVGSSSNNLIKIE